MTDYLIEDPKVEGQNWACISFLTPELVKGCNNHAIKLRGVYNTEAEAIKRINEIKEFDNIHNIYLVEVGKWISWNGDQNVDSNKELNEMMKYYKNKLLNARKEHEIRKKQLMNKEKELENLIKETKEEIISDSLERSEIKKTVHEGKEVKITIDESIPYQNYYCISFLTPENVDNKYNTRGFKIRGVLNKEEEAKKRCKTLYDFDNEHNIYVAEVGHWVNWFDNPEKAEDFEYANEELNSIMKAQKDNQKKVQDFYNKNEIDQNDEEYGKSEYKEDVEEEDNEDEINKELMEAKKMYEKLLEESV